MGTSIGLLILGIALGAVAGGLLGMRTMVSRRAAAAEAERERITADAVRDAEAVRREAQVEAREQAIKLRAEVGITWPAWVSGIAGDDDLARPGVAFRPDAVRHHRRLGRVGAGEGEGEENGGFSHNAMTPQEDDSPTPT